MKTVQLTKPIQKRLERVLAGHPRPIPLHVPTFRGNCAAYVNECIETGWVSSAGAFVERFEADLVRYTGARHAVACVNGTAALHMALLLAGVKPGDEVICPALTFVATANAIRHAEATPHFVDVEPQALGIDPVALERHLEDMARREDDGGCLNASTGRPIRAVVIMHAFGHPADVDGVQAVCEKWGLTLVEDAAESLGSFANGRHTGTIGRLGVLSFNGNKVITTGGGGAILTNDADLAARGKHLTTTAKQPHPWAYVHDDVAYNYRMPNLNAALGCAQLEYLDELLAAKRRLAERYIEAFSDLEGVSILVDPDGCRSNYWLNALVLEHGTEADRDALLATLHEAGFLCRPIWEPMHRLPMFTACPRGALPVTESFAARVVNIPSSAHLATSDIQKEITSADASADA